MIKNAEANAKLGHRSKVCSLVVRASCAEGNGSARSTRAAWANMARCLALNWHGLAADGLNWQHTGCMHRPCVCVGDEGVYVFQKMVRQIF